MFDPGSFRPSGAKLRFAHSPTGAGLNTERQTHNPAWDLQFIVPRVEAGQEVGFRGRLAYRPHTDRDAILREVAAWRDSLA